MIDDKIATRREDVRFRVLRLIEKRPEASQREIADALGVPVSFFFEGLKDEEVAEGAPMDGLPADLMADKEAMELVRSYYAIPENQRRRLFELARVLSDVA